MSTLLLNRRNFTPHLRAKSVSHIDYAKLAGCGIKYLVFDKDNTLTEPYQMKYAAGIHDGLQACRSAYQGEQIAILSNSVGSRDDPGGLEAKEVEKVLGMKVIRHVNKKPDVSDDILRHFATDQVHEVAVVGDRILSDVVMGNSLGMFTIYVDPINKAPENFMVRVVRILEDKVLPMLTPSDGLPPEHKTIKREMLADLLIKGPRKKLYNVPNLTVDCIVTRPRQEENNGMDILLVTRKRAPF